MINERDGKGVGKYMRSEIMYRCAISPFTTAKDLFERNPQGKANLLISACRLLPLEVLFYPPSSSPFSFFPLFFIFNLSFYCYYYYYIIYFYYYTK